MTYNRGAIDQGSLVDHKLSSSGSVLLDLLRLAAAGTVLLSHFGQIGFAKGWPDLTRAGHLAVAVFFVLSGFVIRFVTVNRVKDAKQYLIDRLARMYSVVTPALAITLLCECAARVIYPHQYALLRQPFHWRDVPYQILANLLFQAQNWGYGISPLSNGPFWSISYECQYYTIYGLIFYRVRRGLVLSLLLLLVEGPSIALMFPVWLLGCFAFDTYRKLSAKPSGLGLSSGFLAGVVLILCLRQRSVRLFLMATDDEHRTAWLSTLLDDSGRWRFLYKGGRVPWLTNASGSFVIVGCITAVFIVWALLAVDSRNLKIRPEIVRGARRLADSTFALYLLHLPLLILIVCALGTPVHGWEQSTIVLSLIMITCVAITTPFEALKANLKLRMQSFMASPKSAPPQRLPSG